MKVLTGRNVNDLYASGLALLQVEGKRMPSRAGDVVVTPYPVMSVYKRPKERVLFDPYRDANPFFHLMEALWMLAGRWDAEFLNRYVRDYGERFAEPDGFVHGAYGARWRNHFHEYETGNMHTIDQLAYVVKALRNNPLDRRVVIQMWDPSTDLGADKKDLPCNTQVYPRIVFDAYPGIGDYVLDITVMCRSNDIIWGAYGANAVHFSVLQEYLAAGVGVPMGKMYQLSNNFHAYVAMFDKQLPLWDDLYTRPSLEPHDIITDFDTFDNEVNYFVDNPTDTTAIYRNSFFVNTAIPMARTYDYWRKKQVVEAVVTAGTIKAPDWALACRNWLERRAT